ncbi:site-specific integrase [Muricauda sp. 334s03]|uniref:Site-specific integrase n=1 Tax=Flagellimonas yonaguniensis TaxID=3031325 RepID=A0ABT5Y3P5_9FLAO|nr:MULTISPECIES: site-specific integrase [Allomuricauda]MAU14191.1 integrase [Allomuricauda sp.]MBA4744586.1 site-specific integrase [Allomuricauda sp.]MDF0718072.1 site-specific integrase [[Muricauda] yonaguniensis]NDV17599.1 tyrosine-type recombinase/integrase [Muricauda sp. TY007]|tara:strand:+ start:7738 stop:8994 length:1257 start_codon:yes stop_codon:yes gene_type:complete
MGTTRTFSIHFWLNIAKRNGDSAPIYARVTVDGKRAEISLQRQTSVTYWDTKAKKTTSRTPEGKALNTYLDQVYAKLLQCHKQLSAEFELVTAKSIKARFVGHDERHKTLLELVAYHNQNMKGVLKPGTLKNYYTTENYIRRFLVREKKTNDIYLKHLKYSFIIDFEQYLRKGPSLQNSNPLNNNGVMKHLERLRKLMNLAMDLEWLEKNPFTRYKLKFKRYKKEFLSQEELKLFQEADIEDKGYGIVRDIFVFSCYTGLSYTDVRLLDKSNIVVGIDGERWIFTQREKNEQPVKIPLLEVAKQILEKYEDHPHLNQGKLLPVYSNQKTNAYLKEITALLGISKNLTFHSARHTFATTVTLSNGVPIETVSKMLGHTKISTTQVYARVLEEKISSDMSGLRRALSFSNNTRERGIINL